jgi:hypothetical protein
MISRKTASCRLIVFCSVFLFLLNPARSFSNDLDDALAGRVYGKNTSWYMAIGLQNCSGRISAGFSIPLRPFLRLGAGLLGDLDGPGIESLGLKAGLDFIAPPSEETVRIGGGPRISLLLPAPGFPDFGKAEICAGGGGFVEFFSGRRFSLAFEAESGYRIPAGTGRKGSFDFRISGRFSFYGK